MSATNLSEEICNRAIQCGFDNCGIISIDVLNGFEKLLQKRTENVPQSKFFYDNVGNLQGTKERFPWAKSIVILSFNYGKYCYPKELQGKYAKAFFLEPNEDCESGFDLQRLEQWFGEHGIRAEGGKQFYGRKSRIGHYS